MVQTYLNIKIGKEEKNQMKVEVNSEFMKMEKYLTKLELISQKYMENFLKNLEIISQVQKIILNFGLQEFQWLCT